MKGNRPPHGMHVFAIASRLLALLLPCVVVAALYEVASTGAGSGSRGPEALFDAILRDDVAAVERALALGTPIESTQDGTDLTPLMYAARRGRARQVECLLGRGANLHAASLVYGTPLEVAASNGHADVVRLLIARGADPNQSSSHGLSPLIGAAGSGDAASVELLIGAGATVNARDSHGNTPLLFAAAQGHETVVRQLIAVGADVFRAGPSWEKCLGSCGSVWPSPDRAGIRRLTSLAARLAYGAGGGLMPEPVFTRKSFLFSDLMSKSLNVRRNGLSLLRVRQRCNLLFASVHHDVMLYTSPAAQRPSFLNRF